MKEIVAEDKYLSIPFQFTTQFDAKKKRRSYACVHEFFLLKPEDKTKVDRDRFT